ncbi:MAG TPA: PilW family protein, partial [Gammaproteobacteria bacterium]|nr:PilW family protein [Gammaproteobacteria bacterium]
PVLNRRSSEVNPVNPEEVIEGVENMQILYGEDTAGNDQIADTYVTAAAVADWDNVVSVRVSLLMRSVEEYGPDQDNATYDLLGTIIDPVDDRRRRRVFTATIQLRNRIASS